MLRNFHEGLKAVRRITEIVPACIAILTLIVVLFFEPHFFDE